MHTMTRMKMTVIEVIVIMNMLMLIRKMVMVCSNLFTICTLGGQRSPIAYPGRDPRFHMATLNWIPVHSLSKVCSSLQPQQHSRVAPIRTMRPRSQFWWKTQLDFNENALLNRKGKTRLVCIGGRPSPDPSKIIALIIWAIWPPMSST